MSLRVSVVIPTYRRPELLGRCLAALAAQTMPPDSYEILVADDAAESATQCQVEAVAQKAPCAVHYLPVLQTPGWGTVSGPCPPRRPQVSTEHGRPAVSGLARSPDRARTDAIHYVPLRQAHGPGAARNAGWRAARAPLIAFTDDDTVPDAGWLAAGVGALERDSDLAAVTGQVIVPLPPAPTDYERNEAGLETAEFVTANCFCRRAVLEKLGGFDERFTAAWREDSDLHFRLLASGAKLRKVPEAIVVHPVRPAPWGVSLRMQRKSQFDALLYQKHPALYRQRIRRWPPWDYYGILVAVAVAFFAAVLGKWIVGVFAVGAWTVLMGRFLMRRLRGNSRRPGHVVEMLATSLLIPFLSVFWRLYGAVRFRVWFW